MNKINLYKILAAIFLVAIVITVFRVKLSDSYIKKGANNLSRNYFKSALSDFEKASILMPNNEYINIKTGEIYLLYKNYNQAEKQFKKAVKANKKNPISYTYLIKTLILENKINDAETVIKKIPRKIGNDDNLSTQKARVYADLGKIDDAINILNQDSKKGKFYKSLFLISKGQLKESQDIINNLKSKESSVDSLPIINKTFEKIQNSDNTTFKSITLAEALNEINEPYLAEIILNKVIKDNPKYRDAFIYLGYSNILKENYNQASDNIQKAIQEDPAYGLSYYFLGEVRLKENNANEAINNINKTVNLGYKNKNTYKLLGNINEQQENNKTAEENFYKALTFAPKDETVLMPLINVIIKQGKLTDAEKIAATAENNKLLGWVYVEKGDKEKALEYLQKAEAKEPSSAFISLKLGELYKKQSNEKEYKDYFLKTIEYDLSGDLAKLAKEYIK